MSVCACLLYSLPMSYEIFRIQTHISFVYKLGWSLYTNFFVTHRNMSRFTVNRN